MSNVTAILFRVSRESRSDPLMMTDYTSERKFKEVNEIDLNDLVHKNIIVRVGYN